jgi:hypothetical protein
MPIEAACDFTEFALLGTAALRRYSTPGRTDTIAALPGGRGFGRSDSAVVSMPALSDGHVHNLDARPLYNNPSHGIYWQSSKVLLWDSKAMKFSNDEIANRYVDTPYRKEWDYKV